MTCRFSVWFQRSRNTFFLSCHVVVEPKRQPSLSESPRINLSTKKTCDAVATTRPVDSAVAGAWHLRSLSPFPLIAFRQRVRTFISPVIADIIVCHGEDMCCVLSVHLCHVVTFPMLLYALFNHSALHKYADGSFTIVFLGQCVYARSSSGETLDDQNTCLCRLGRRHNCPPVAVRFVF